MSCSECKILASIIEKKESDDNHWFKEYQKMKEKGDEHIKKEYEQDLTDLKKQLDALRTLVIAQAEEIRQERLKQSNPQGKIVEVRMPTATEKLKEDMTKLKKYSDEQRELFKRNIDDYYGEYARPMQFIPLEKVLKRPVDLKEDEEFRQEQERKEKERASLKPINENKLGLI